MATIKKNLRLFNGFPFAGDSEEFSRKREKLLRWVRSVHEEEEDEDCNHPLNAGTPTSPTAS